MTAIDSSLVAINWEFELRGIIVTLIGVGVLMGSIYLVLATNLGARLGFLVALGGLSGWLALMGVDLVDLRHRPEGSRAVVGGGRPAAPCCRTRPPSTRPGSSPSPSRSPMRRRTPTRPTSSPTQFASPRVGASSTRRRRRPDKPVLRPASSSRRPAPSRQGSFQVTRVFDTGGDRYPMIGDFDLLAFWHEPRYVLVEVAPVEPTRARARAGGAEQPDRREPAAPVRLHGPRPRRPPPAGVRPDDRGDDHLPDVVLAAPPARDARPRQPQPAGTAPAPSAGS